MHEQELDIKVIKTTDGKAFWYATGDNNFGFLQSLEFATGELDVTVVVGGSIRTGFGSRLLRCWVESVGSGRQINSAVSHDPTHDHLHRIGLFTDLPAYPGIISVTDPAILSEVPIVKFCNSGGVLATHLEICQLPKPTDGGLKNGVILLGYTV